MEEQKKPLIKKRRTVFDIDDGGSFDQIVQETRRYLVGSCTDQTVAGEATNLLQFRVLEAFVNHLLNDKKVPTKKEKTGSLKIVLKRNRPEGTLNRPDDDDGGNCKKNKAKKMMINPRKKGGIINLYDKGLEPPKLSSSLKKRIEEKGGTDLKLVIMKQLFNGDLEKQQGRLTMPRIQIRDESFLAIPEISAMSPNEKLPVMFMEPRDNETTMVLTKWRVSKSFTYALIKHWNEVLDRNLDRKYFKLRDVIQVWSFKVAGQLWFAIDKVWDAPI